jgi:glycosyltransferase involved in cell wall biosynthesis
MTVVGCSKWITGLARESSLFQQKDILDIPNPINTDIFAPSDKLVLRKKLNINHKKIILYGATNVLNKNKGLDYFIDGLKLLKAKYPSSNEDLGIILFGKSTKHIINLLPYDCYDFSIVHSEDKMAELYNVSDVYVTSSLDENLPNTIMESMSCSTPAVAFNVGGIPEMIDHKSNGYLADYQSSEDLCEGIRWVLYEADEKSLNLNARTKVIKQYDQQIIAKKYLDLYKHLLNNTNQ